MELKFRAWEFPMKNNPIGRIFYHDELLWNFLLKSDGKLVWSDGKSLELVEDSVMLPMIFTGFSDKLGNEIYEGDILEMADGAKIIVNDLAEFLIYCGKYEEKNGVELFPSISVVGNVYENGDLI